MGTLYNTLLLTLKNSTRQELNEQIRETLKKNNELTNHTTLDIRENKQLDATLAHHYSSYSLNDEIVVQKSFAKFQAGSAGFIVAINEETNTITIKTDREEKEIDLLKHADKIQAYSYAQKEFSHNDKIIFTKKSKTLGTLGVQNGDIATITHIDNDKITAKIKDKEVTFSTQEYNYIDHAYAITNHKAQGQTAERSIFVADAKLTNTNAFYVALTRAKQSFKIYTDSKELFKELATSAQQKKSTLDFVDTNKLKKEITNGTRKTIESLHRIAESKSRSINEDSRTALSRARGRESAFASVARDKRIACKYREKLAEVAEAIKEVVQKLQEKLLRKEHKETIDEAIDIKELYKLSLSEAQSQSQSQSQSITIRR